MVQNFIGRFPKASYSSLSKFPEPLIHFLMQVGHHDFRSSETLRVSLPYLAEREWLFGLFPIHSLQNKATPEIREVSPQLIDGWQQLGLIGLDGRFDFALSPTLVAERFRRVTGRSLVPTLPQSDPQTLHARVREFLQGRLAVDDVSDFLFAMPLLTSPAAVRILEAFGDATEFDVATLYDDVASDSMTKGDASTFLRLLNQDHFASESALYGAGPIVQQGKVDEGEREECLAGVVRMGKWLLQVDAILLGPIPNRDVFAFLTSPNLAIAFQLPVRDLLDSLAMGVGAQLYRLAHVVEKRGFTPAAFAFARVRAELLLQLLRRTAHSPSLDPIQALPLLRALRGS